jgi:hypothetical protein
MSELKDHLSRPMPGSRLSKTARLLDGLTFVLMAVALGLLIAPSMQHPS